jgi:hypothetical protein
MEDEAQDRCGSDGNSGSPEKPSSKRVFLWTAISLAVLLVLAFFLGVPYFARREMGSGSDEYARQWKTQLLACQSLDDVKQHFNCMEWVPVGDRSAQMVQVTADVPGRAEALIDSFPDGKWIACAYGNSHGGPGGGTVVARDSNGEVHVFFGHVCGRPHAWGDTLEEFYRRLRDNSRFEEQPQYKFE